MNKRSIILIIVGIGLALMGGTVLYLYSTPYDFPIQAKEYCKQYGGEWEKELEICVNIDKEACELSYGVFVLPEELPESFVIHDGIESLCIGIFAQPTQ